MAPASPEAAGIARFGNYQVNLFTGVPEISIPLYEIQVGELKVPISINYHASGIKVNDIATRVGLGWSLSAGGVITRKIMGKPDEVKGNYLRPDADKTTRLASEISSAINNNSEEAINYLRNVYLGYADVEPDIFSYSFPGHSGKFLFNQKENFNPLFIPYAPLSVAKSFPNDLSLEMSMTDESGIQYKFNNSNSEYTRGGGGKSTDATSAWNLSEMISSNNQDKIRFIYQPAPNISQYTDFYYSDYVVVNDQATGSCTADMGNHYRDQVYVTTNWKMLTEINFKNGKVVFEGAPEKREDFSGSYQLQPRLKTIKIYNYDPIKNVYNLIRSIEFDHSYFINGTDANTKRLRLDGIQTKSSNGSVLENYKFNYNNSIALPSNTSQMKDYWGYFNNVNNQRNLNGTMVPTMVKKMEIPYQQGLTQSKIWIGGDHENARDPNPNYMQAWILQKITFPTGGSTEFTYETNKYQDDDASIKNGGGLRISTIKSYDGVSYDGINAKPILKTYKYGSGESGFGRKNFLLEDHFFLHVENVRVISYNSISQCDEQVGTKTTRTYFANPTNDIESYDGAPVVYPMVTEYIGDLTTNTGRTIYQFSDRPDGKTTQFALEKPIMDSYHFIRGLPTNKSTYRKNADNTYSIVTETKKGYKQFPLTFSTNGIALGVRKNLVTYNEHGEVNLGIGGGACLPEGDKNSYNFNNYEIVSADNKLTSETTTIYDQKDPTKSVSTTTSYTYDDAKHLQLSKTATVNSKGETLLTTNTYPHNSTASPYTLMTEKHIYDKVVTETRKNNTTNAQLIFQNNDYQSFSGPNYLPRNIQLQVKTNALETRATFNSYDLRGNILEMQKVNDVKQSFIWDYQSIHAVAQVTNAPQSEIAYTSFEADGTGGWSGINFSNAVTLGSVTGKKSYYAGNFSFSKSGLTAASAYIVSYWSRNGASSITGTITGWPKALRTITVNAQIWTYYEHSVSGQTTITVTGSGYIDELRLYPNNAQMTTYTYEPLIGVSSQADANNRITYYTYDALGRLLLVRDDNKNILKKLCYNYYGLPGSCTFYQNDEISRSYTKNNCGDYYVGSAVTYTVPAGTYFSTSLQDANAQAANDTAANGQTYANQNGTCTYTTATISVFGNNSQPLAYNVKFTNVNTSQFYAFTILSGASNINLGSIPVGKYDVMFYPSGSNTTPFNFKISSAGGTTFYESGISKTIYNVDIKGDATATIY